MAVNLVRRPLGVRGWILGRIDHNSARKTEETTMSGELEANAEGVDFALVAYREEGVWQGGESGRERRGAGLSLWPPPGGRGWGGGGGWRRKSPLPSTFPPSSCPAPPA